MTTADITKLRKYDESNYFAGTKKSSITELKQTPTEIGAERSYWYKLHEDNKSRIEPLETALLNIDKNNSRQSCLSKEDERV